MFDTDFTAKKKDEDYAVEDQARRDEVVRIARLKGFTVVEGDDYHLLLDIDSKVLDAKFWTVFSMLLDRFHGDYEKWRSKSGNWHIYVELDLPLPLLERIALQAMCGSDPRKEMMSLCSACRRNGPGAAKPPQRRLTFKCPCCKSSGFSPRDGGLKCSFCLGEE
jgi:hypothetical protein